MSDQLDKAIQARDEFIATHPGAAKFQRDLDIELSALTDPIERLSVILKKISDNAATLRRLVNDLSR